MTEIKFGDIVRFDTDVEKMIVVQVTNANICTLDKNGHVDTWKRTASLHKWGRDINWKPYPIKEQVARIGNSVVPVMAESLVRANCSYLRIGERTPNIAFRNVNGQMEIAV